MTHLVARAAELFQHFRRIATKLNRAPCWSHGRLILLVVCALSGFCQASQYPQPILQTGETGQAWSMDFSPNGAFLAVANDHRVSLWDHEHRWLIRQFVGHTASVRAVAFSPTGKILASGSSEGEVATWDVETGALLKLRKANNSEIAGLKYTSDGKIVTAGWDQTVRIWDDGTCESSCILTHTSGSPQSLAVSFDDQFIGIGDDANTVTVWRIDLPKRTAQIYKTLTLPDEGSPDPSFIRGLAFDKFGRCRSSKPTSVAEIALRDSTDLSVVAERSLGRR
jgi:WD40 repeat protein